MTDSETKTGGPDHTRINVYEPEELREWATKLDTTPEQLTDAVDAVGDFAPDVEMYLKGSHATSNADQEKRVEAADRHK